MSKSVKLTWTLPTQRVGGQALPASAIGSVEVAISADQGANYVSLASLPPTATEFTQTELEGGTYFFQVTVVDKQSPMLHWL
jgi:hypothetical protein